MDVLLRVVGKYRFTRLNSSLRQPIVFHCVPGAGKSTCIRELINLDSRFSAYTLGIPDRPNLQGIGIKQFEGQCEQGKLCILDEYTLGPFEPNLFFAVFGDPIQHKPSLSLRADFICCESRRFGRCTAQLLRTLGFEIQAEGDDVVNLGKVYGSDLTSVILYYEPEVGCILRAHNLRAFNPEEVVGQTFECVTFITGKTVLPIEERELAYQCLTRHSKELHVLTPDATYSAT
ncbi:triple gene block protein 1 [Atractylodes mottle virus]|uniref:Triple gene block protein 1 n=1 Tax=Atractylodes mottle virus TaxID=1702121 RepID=A0A0K2BNJ8_9VIRU|nr:triple gene block protein 1 [Atractylodes mottle virus]AKZ66615.1 triple gene block protein 1 [Atractylodes mottle virus]